MSKFSVYINAPEYLDQWLRHEYWDEETQRVVFPRGSAPRAVLGAVLRKPPKRYLPSNGPCTLPVEVPTFKGVNPATFNYLTLSGHSALISACKTLFKACLFTELSGLFEHDIQITDIIYDFMDRHGIERHERNWETIRQMYLRMRKKSQIYRG